MTENVYEQPILGLGGTGKTGRRVLDRLIKLDRPVRVGSRSGVPPFDRTDQRTWAPVLDGNALGRKIRYRSVPPEEYAAGVAGYDVPAELAAVLTELFDKVLDGRNAQLTDGVQRALGRKPRGFADYARDAAAAGAWDTSPGEKWADWA
ncbi:hypothetical protein [Micromonospora sp. NBC_01638]|uniref:hypothetical protein n=1 Tax=Micromonospora sp. NBC_01638 TaxID=2975982 RepID=UPI00386ADC80|nr:hypothetical protein OG811_19495 [Micromonospora sp. NBC_01638]